MSQSVSRLALENRWPATPSVITSKLVNSPPLRRGWFDNPRRSLLTPLRSLNPEHSIEPRQQLRSLLITQLRQVLKFPAHGRQILCTGKVEHGPVWLATFDRNQEAPVLFWHLSDNFVNEIFTRTQKFIERHGFVDHSFKTPLVFD